ncbi:stealth family protein [Legionella impletisoli]|uniref:Capsular polysaccharide phosphotransferase cps12A n=1 Tax=Legionella impletisoli TaxID=343510 RepID=A0A917JW26_9GAMM|nr:stealth family protein [Legionella impletisoli]GGI85250.1 hypothetical protein GCM10007966_12330 [Legionella impletisoli]
MNDSLHKEPIDAVITWVDGRDPNHQKKLADYLATLGISRPTSAAPTRFNECGELTYSVFSLLHYAPWIRTIFLVTDDQTPPVLKLLQGTQFEKKLKLIDHRELFKEYEQYLPTFNSITIESMLWRIPELAERFIYFNDDCLLVRPLNYEDFFNQNKPVLRGVWKTQHHKKWHTQLILWLPYWLRASNFYKPVDEHRALQENTAKKVGFKKRFFHLHHVPFSLCKTTFKDYFSNHPELLSANIVYPLRDKEQFWPISLAHHLDLKNHNAVVDLQLKAIMVNGAFHSLKKIRQRLHQIEKNNQIAFLCMQSIDSAPPEIQQCMLDWLDEHIPLRFS